MKARVQELIQVGDQLYSKRFRCSRYGKPSPRISTRCAPT